MDRIPAGTLLNELPAGLLPRKFLSGLLPEQQSVMQQAVQKFQSGLPNASENKSIKDQLLTLDLLAYHESGGSMRPTQRQKLGGGKRGPAIGALQWEPQRALTSLQRANNIVAETGAKTPRWLEVLNKNISGLNPRKTKDADKIRNSIAQLSYDQQRDLALADLTKEPKTSLRLVDPRNVDQVSNLWSKGWHKGDSNIENFKDHHKLWSSSGEVFIPYSLHAILQENPPQRKPVRKQK